jgi:phospholipid/cholesterol/gamma-HCH transport system ATP-binding protein
MTDMAIRIVDLEKSFGSQRVLDCLNLDIQRGKITVIIGKSGGGKSVLLKHLIGLMKPDRGSVWVNDVDITKLKEKDLNSVREKFGMLFQDAALFDSMDVWDNVAFPLQEHTKLGNREIERIVEERLRQVGLLGFGEKMPAELSGGMKKRVGLARALVMDPDIVLFDEPTTGLDPIISLTIEELIKETQLRLGKTYVVISHDISATFRLADMVAVLCDGRIIDYGTPYEVRRSKNEFTKEFLKATKVPGLSGGAL